MKRYGVRLSAPVWAHSSKPAARKCRWMAAAAVGSAAEHLRRLCWLVFVIVSDLPTDCRTYLLYDCTDTETLSFVIR